MPKVAFDPTEFYPPTDDPVLLKQHLHGWIEAAAQHSENTTFYRDIVMDCAKLLGQECHRDDSGVYQTEPLALRVTEVLKDLIKQRTHGEQFRAVHVEYIQEAIKALEAQAHGRAGHSQSPYVIIAQETIEYRVAQVLKDRLARP